MITVCEDLRKAVLQAAIQGKLTEQLPSDGKAEDLYQAIQKEKQALIKAGKLKKEKALPEISEDEVPFDIPENWKFIRIGETGSWASGATPFRGNSKYYGGNIPWLKTGDLNDGYINDIPENITDLALKQTSVRLNPIGSVLMAMYGATIGKLGILEIEATTNQACCACIPYHGVINKYLFYYLMAMREKFIGIAEGGAQPNISKEKIVNSIIPLPPLSEQKRIVEKIDELMAKIDEAEKTENQLLQLYKEFPGEMKSAILQAAIQGKLTEQLASDGDAETLYRAIQEEKQALIKAGKLKKEKPLPGISEDEIPFDIPENWKWIRLGEVCSIINGDRGKNYPAKNTLKTSGIPFISAVNLNGKNVSEDEKLLCLSESQYNKLGSGKLEQNDVVVCIRGSLGKHGVYQFEKGAIASSLAILRIVSKHKQSLTTWLFLYLESALFYSEIKRFDNGTAQPNIAANSLAKFLIPFPPLAEQQRIVERLDQLLPLCDAIAERISKTE